MFEWWNSFLLKEQFVLKCEKLIMGEVFVLRNSFVWSG